MKCLQRTAPVGSYSFQPSRSSTRRIPVYRCFSAHASRGIALALFRPATMPSPGTRTLSPPSRSLSTSIPSSPASSLAFDEHAAAVAAIAADVAHFHAHGTKYRIFHGSTNSTRPRPAGPTVDTSPLRRVLRVDRSVKRALVEPNVPMDRLVEATLAVGLVPPVVTEFPGITAGGAYAGTAGESSSFRDGYFSDNVERVEMVLADGSAVSCSREERPDLFAGAAGAVGTLGVTTLLELRLREAKKFVLTTYHPVRGIEDAAEKIKEMSANEELDYLDGIMFSRESGAIITGRLTDKPPTGTRVQCFSSAGDPWFFMHVRDRLFSGNTSSAASHPVTEAIPLAEYLFRYDRGGFWVGLEAFSYFNFVPFNSYTRWFLDDFLHTRMMYAAFHASGQSARFIVQDLALPFETAPQFAQWTYDSFGIFPLWLCPLMATPGPDFHPRALRHREGMQEISGPSTTKAPGGEELLLNIGLWGPGPQARGPFVDLNKRLEAKLLELGGTKWLYAHTYYSEDEFWRIYDKKWYDELRERYGATSLPNVWEKVRVDLGAQDRQEKEMSGLGPWGAQLRNQWPLGGLWGVANAIKSGSWRDARASRWKSI